MTKFLINAITNTIRSEKKEPGKVGDILLSIILSFYYIIKNNIEFTKL